MRHLAAYLLCYLGGKATPSAEDVQAVLEAAGAAVDSGVLDALVQELGEKNIEELFASGKEKIKDAGGAGGAVAVAAAGAPSAAGASAAVAVAAPEPEAKKEEEEEIDLGGGMDMFGGGEAGGGDY